MLKNNIRSYIAKNLIKARELYYVKPEEIDINNIIIKYSKSNNIVSRFELNSDVDGIGRERDQKYYWGRINILYKYPDGQIKPLCIKTTYFDCNANMITSSELENIFTQISNVIIKQLEIEQIIIKNKTIKFCDEHNHFMLDYSKNIEIINLLTQKMSTKTNGKKYEILDVEDIKWLTNVKYNRCAKYIINPTIITQSCDNNIIPFCKCMVDVMEIKHKMSTAKSLVDDCETIYSSSNSNKNVEICL